VAEPGWYLNRTLEQVGDERAKGLLERDVGNVLAFFKRKYGVEREVEEVMSAELSQLSASGSSE
jgi:RIO-like serine/threonine protein kinase